MLNVLQEHRIPATVLLSEGFGQGLGAPSYSAYMANTKLALAPGGNAAETIRFYDALEILGASRTRDLAWQEWGREHPTLGAHAGIVRVLGVTEDGLALNELALGSLTNYDGSPAVLKIATDPDADVALEEAMLARLAAAGLPVPASRPDASGQRVVALHGRSARLQAPALPRRECSPCSARPQADALEAEGLLHEEQHGAKPRRLQQHVHF